MIWVFAAFSFLVIYHYIGYPIIVLLWARALRSGGVFEIDLQSAASALPKSQVMAQERVPSPRNVQRVLENDLVRSDLMGSEVSLPTVSVVVPIYNEQACIEAKLRNLIVLEYPADRLEIILAFDGCTDRSVAIAQSAIASAGHPAHIVVREFRNNRGKVAVLNDVIGSVGGELVALTDASAMLPRDALRRLAAHFSDPSLGVACASYAFQLSGSPGESGYWTYQTAIKDAEGRIAAPIGPHGAFYMIRRRMWAPLPADTINDDFLLPMTIVCKGARGIYDRSVVTLEFEQSNLRQDFRRRMRLGAGNVQQILRLVPLLQTMSWRLAFLVFSGKGLRAFAPILLLLSVGIGAALAIQGSMIFAVFSIGSFALLGLGLTGGAAAEIFPKPLRAVVYLVRGLVASAIGAALFLVGLHGRLWNISSQAKRSSSTPEPAGKSR